MNELNQQISDIFKRHSKTTPPMIQELFNLLPLHPPQQKKIIQTAILYSMQNMHEWDNIISYIEKWQRYDFRHELVLRMRTRLQDSSPIAPIDSEAAQLKRLVQKYWLVLSPKKNENKYKEPINMKIIRKHTDRLPRKSQNQPIFSNADPQSQLQVQSHKSVPQSNLQAISQQYESPNKSNSQRIVKKEDTLTNKYKADPYLSLTGRPAILKKNTIFEQPKSKIVKFDQKSDDGNKPNNIQLQNQVDLSRQRQRLGSKIKQFVQVDNKNVNILSTANSKTTVQISKIESKQGELSINDIREQEIHNIPKDNISKQNSKSIAQAVSHEELSPNFHQIEENNVMNVNEPYPNLQQFNFGTSKKTKDAEMKQFSVSPIGRMSIGPKILKINRSATRHEQEDKNQNIALPYQLQDFSFRDDVFAVHFTKHDDNDIIKLPQSSSSDNHLNILPEIIEKDSKSQQQSQKQLRKQTKQTNIVTKTQVIQPANVYQAPYCQTASKRNHNKQFLSREEMKVVDDVKPTYLFHNLLKKKGYNAMSVFERIFDIKK